MFIFTAHASVFKLRKIYVEVIITGAVRNDDETLVSVIVLLE